MKKGGYMKKLLNLLGATALISLFAGCAPESSELSLDSASDNYIMYNGMYTEYGRCNDAWDNDGDGLRDEEDPDCHVPGPLRDLSIAPALTGGAITAGHNFVPDVSKIPFGGPGYPGGFRDPQQIANWIGFLTNYYGWTAGIVPQGWGVDPLKVPVPMDSFPKLRLGTAHQGNNGNLGDNAISPFYTGAVVNENMVNTVREIASDKVNDIRSVRVKNKLNALPDVVNNNRVFDLQNKAVAPVLNDRIYTAPFGNNTEGLYKRGSQGFSLGVN
jgi:hypothetical protein